jgi:LCP family protein required for cell wall assembly
LELLEPKKFGIFSSVKNLLFHSGEVIEGQKEDRINILLLGIGGDGHDGPYLSDTNIIVSIKPSTREVAMVSIPRDLGIKIADKGINKINYASALGENLYPGEGGEYARKIFEETFGLPIPYYVRVDFKAFEEIINLVGGLDVEINNSFIDQAYPGENYSYQTVQFEKGIEHMNGARALIYARSRHGTNGENSDFARSRRQQQIMALLKDKLLSFEVYANPMKVKEIIDSLSSHINTNLNISQIIYLGNMVRQTNQNDIKNLVLDSGVNGFTVPYIATNGAFMLAPRGGKLDYINYAIAKIFLNVTTTPNWSDVIDDESVYKFSTVKNENTSSTEKKYTIPLWPNIKIEIYNGTWRGGLASRYQSKLSDNGFNVVNIGNAENRPIEKTTIYIAKKDLEAEIMEALTKEITGDIINSLPSWYLKKFPISTSSLPNNYEGLEEEEEAEQTLTNPLISDIIIVLGTDTKE